MKKAFSRKNLWDRTPLWLKSTVGAGLGLVPPAWLLGGSFRRNCRFLQEAQRWSREQARVYQLRRLREMLALAYEKTSFYRRTFDAAGFQPGDFKSLDDMARLPMISKQTVTESLAEMCTRDVNGPDVDFGSTGGTSGTPLQFYLDANRSSIEYAYLTTSWQRAGYRLGMPMAVLRGRMVKPDRSGFYHEYDPILRHHYYSNFHLSDANMQRYLEHLRTIGPCAFHAYPSSAHAFAKFILNAARPPLQNVKAVLLESENVYTDQVSDIENALGARCFSSYGHSEKLVLAAQCEHTRNYHIWPTYGYFELVDEEGKPIEQAGQEGEIAGTGFMNTIVPFIRYRTGDRAVYVGQRCEACGREHPIVASISGRWPQGGLVAADGSIVTLTTLNVHDDTFRKVREYQYHQTVPGRATLCVVPVGVLDEDEKQRIAASMNKRLQGQVVLSLEVRTELVKTARGKQPRVVQQCPSSS